MSTSAVAAPASPPRATRPSQPRPTTFTGPSPSAPSSGPPIPPPRTSSQGRPGTGTSGHDDRRNSASASAPGRSGSNRNSTGGGGRREGRSNSGAGQSRRTRAAGDGSQVVGGRGGRKETRFGEYILGQTLGEGEFGKVKLGWRRDGGVQVAIKLIRRDSVSPHPNRLSKIYREISILRTLSHPNIVRLHEMVETDRHIGIILEYASGGELFDYILTHRFLKDPPACRLFAQLVSGVGYLHKKGIVHRDLKLENLLLDRNRNIIITDFGFANVFDPTDELGELEDRLNDPVVLKELEKGVPNDVDPKNGSNLLGILGPGQVRRRGDLMATSCGSPCYAAPELVVSDGLYTGRKVDVWSCGVILYAMLAGYLPFDDDPANPEGDNINLLYKYIVSTPLTFPEYVTPHARDLLRRILVPDPRKRADLFEVARHSWLAPFADIVNKVTSATTGIKDVETITVRETKQEVPHLTRSASVREPPTTTSSLTPTHLSTRHDHIPATNTSKPSTDTKRRTVQVEYVEPATTTKRGSTDAARPPTSSRVERATTSAGTTSSRHSKSSKPAPPTASAEKGKARPASYQYPPTSRVPTDGATSSPPSRRPSKERHTTIAERRPSTARAASDIRTTQQKPHPTISTIPQSPITPASAVSPVSPVSPLPTQPSTQQQSAKGHKRANTVAGSSESRFSRILPSAAPSQRISVDVQRTKPERPGTNRRRFSLLPSSFTLSRHERKASRSNSRQNVHPDSISHPSLQEPEPWNGGVHSGQGHSETSIAAVGSLPDRQSAGIIEEKEKTGFAGMFGRSEKTEKEPGRKEKKGMWSKHRKFGDAYGEEDVGGRGGSSGAARRVMDFFRRRGVMRGKGAA